MQADTVEQMREIESQESDDEIGGCHICAQTFSTEEELSRHLLEAHGGRDRRLGSK